MDPLSVPLSAPASRWSPRTAGNISYTAALQIASRQGAPLRPQQRKEARAADPAAYAASLHLVSRAAQPVLVYSSQT